MGWSLISREIIKDCGCVKETRTHDDFPTYDYTIILCNTCQDAEMKRRQEKKAEMKMLYDMFVDELKHTEVKLVPRKEAKTIVGKHPHSGEVFDYRIHGLINYQKIRGRYYLNINAVELFYKLELDKYYLLKVF